MRKKFLERIAICFVIAVALSFVGCQQDENLSDSNNVPTSQNIIDYDISKLPYEMTERENTLAKKALQVMDNHIQFKNNKYVLNVSNGLSIGLSERVFNYYKTRMVETNKLLNGACIIPINNKKVEIRCASYLPITSRVAGGINKIVTDWYSFDLYLSNKTLVSLAAGAGLAGTLAGLAPDPTITKIVGTVAGFCSFSFSMLANYYPNGVIISCIYVSLPYPGCIPYNIKEQKV